LLTEAFNRMLARVEAQDSQLRLSQQQFESLVNSINGIVWETDPFTLKTLFVSPQVEAILGYPRERWLQHPTFWQERRHPEDQERTAALLHNLIEVGKPFHLEYRMLHASGQVLWFQDNINILMQDGQPRLLRGVTLDITAQKLAQAKLAEAQKKLLETSRLAGMAEIAAGVLHNVGNVLNSVNVSVSLLQENVKKSQIQNFAKAANLLRDHAADTAAFLTHDPKGQRLPGYLIGLSDHVASEQLAWQNELDRLSKNIEHIKEIVAMQQNYARISGIMEVLNAQELVEDALRMNDAALGRHGVKVVREYQKTPLVTVDRHKVLQILINLIRNSKYAMDKADKSDRTLTVAIGAGGDGGVSIQVRDNGIGIPAENLTRIFQHGFTTKQEGHGFGLHSAANAAKELGGRLTAQSDGPGQGAVFILDLPAASPKTNGPLARQLQPAWHSPTSEI
jgi:PAS domain S-box-containing protein